jgi:hypothetical protein
MSNAITEVRTPKGQRNFTQLERRIIKWCHEQDETAEDVAIALNRKVGAVKTKAAQIGYPLKGKR